MAQAVSHRPSSRRPRFDLRSGLVSSWSTKWHCDFICLLPTSLHQRPIRIHLSPALHNLRNGQRLKINAYVHVYRGPGQLSQYSDSLPSGGRAPVRRNFPHRSRPALGPPSLLYNRHRISHPGVKWPGRGVATPSPSSTEVKERVQIYLYSRSRPSWPVLG